MLKRLMFWSLLLAPVIGGSALAQVDPDPDGIGIYADPDAYNSTAPATSGTQVQLYLVLTRPSTSNGILGWECGVEPPSGAILMGWTIPHEHLNIGSGNDFVVAYPLSLPADDAVVLASTTVISSSNAREEFFITPGPTDEASDGLPNYVDAADVLFTMTPYPWGVEYPTFVLNGTIGEDEETRWGSVKSLYRN